MIYIIYFFPKTVVYNTTLDGRPGRALAWHTHGRVFAPHSLQQVLRFVASIYTVQHVELVQPCVGWGVKGS